MTTFTQEQLIAKQHELESRGRDLGELRFDRRTENAIERKAEDGTSYGAALIASRVAGLATVIEKAVNPEKGRAMAVLKDTIDGLDYRVVAMVSLSAVIASASHTPKATALSQKIAEAVFLEAQRAALSSDALKHFKRTIEKTGNQGRDAAKTLDFISGVHEETIEEWDKETKIKLGRVLLSLLCDETGLFEIRKEEETGAERKTPEVVVATDELNEYIAKNREEMRALSPVYLPMVVKPQEWHKGNIYGGCYLTKEQAPVPFVKRKNPAQMARLLAENPENMFEAVNKAQETAIRVRVPVLKLLTKIQEQKIDLGLKASSMPLQNDKEIDESASWFTQKSIEQANNEQANLRMVVATNIALAEEFAEFERFYVPHHVDTRGRVYPITPLNLQGADYIKGLLEFAEGKRIGEEGIEWLKIHTANLFGVDKVSFEERVEWVDQNMAELIASALDPLKSTFWTTADKPIQAFAACIELLGVQLDGEDYISRMPIALDGSCSGLQHLGAAFRCSVTAKAVNLLPGDKPNDIYQDVADKVQKALELDGSPMAREWLSFCGGTIGRKITKRSVMTFPYGSKASGFADQLMTDIIKPFIKDNPEANPFEEPRKAAQFLAGYIYDAVSATVLKAAEAMEWLQQAAGAIAAGGSVVNWTTPLGFPVVQDYRKTNSRKIDSVIFGKRLRNRFTEETDKIDALKMANAIAPNVVHSLDSSHLLLTVLRANEEGLTDFALIHDSFGTHAAETGRFFQIIRETFVELYSENVFEYLEEEFKPQVDEAAAKKKKKAIPELPTKGDYELNSIIDSLFAFA